MKKSIIEPGFVGFTRSDDFMGKLIRLGESLTSHADVNHMFIVGDHGKVIQAQMKGVTYDASLDQMLAHQTCYVLRPPGFVDLRKVVDFGEFYVNTAYGLGTDVAIGIDMLTSNWVPAFRGARKDSIICSALGMQALRFGGWLHHFVDVYSCTPQQVKDALLSDGAVLVHPA